MIFIWWPEPEAEPAPEDPEVDPSVLLRPPDEAAEGERLGEVMVGSPPPPKGERTFDPPEEVEVTS